MTPLLVFAAGLAHAVSAGSAPGAGGQPGEVRDLQPVANAMERLGELVVRDARIPGMAMAMVQGDRVLLARGYGVRETGGRDPVDAETVFRIASLSKPFASTLAALLRREGALDWDTRVIEHLPALRLGRNGSASRLTLRDILSHRVGLPYNTHDRLLEANEPYPVLVQKLAAVDPTCAVGGCYAYQNIAYSLVGDVVFSVTGDFYTHQVERRLFHPLNMYTATFGREALEASGNWARPHVRHRDGWRAVRPKPTYYRIPPAAGVNASAADMAEWIKAQLGHYPEVVDQALRDELWRPQVATPDQLRSSRWRRERLRNAWYGLGWRIYDYAGHELVYHGGAVEGYRALVAILPDEDFGMVVLWHAEDGTPAGLMATALDRVLGLPARDWLQLEKLRARRAGR